VEVVEEIHDMANGKVRPFWSKVESVYGDFDRAEVGRVSVTTRDKHCAAIVP
jgi:hypothetical protein